MSAVTGFPLFVIACVGSRKGSNVGICWACGGALMHAWPLLYTFLFTPH